MVRQHPDDVAELARVAGRAGVTLPVKHGSIVARGQKAQTLTSVVDMRERRRDSRVIACVCWNL